MQVAQLHSKNACARLYASVGGAAASSRTYARAYTTFPSHRCISQGESRWRLDGCKSAFHPSRVGQEGESGRNKRQPVLLTRKHLSFTVTLTQGLHTQAANGILVRGKCRMARIETVACDGKTSYHSYRYHSYQCSTSTGIEQEVSTMTSYVCVCVFVSLFQSCPVMEGEFF